MDFIEDTIKHAIANKPRFVIVKKVNLETPKIKTFIFNDEACSKAFPGQFIMLWIPGLDEIPISLSIIHLNDSSAITVKKVGEASEAVHDITRGDVIGIRGPYGHGFTSVNGNVMIVGGGIGMASLAPLSEILSPITTRITLIVGAKTRDELLFPDWMRLEFSKIDSKIIITTEDGSIERRGLATDPVKELLEKQRFDVIYTCGPEKMILKMYQLAEIYKTPIQASLERIIRCSIGLCGSCMIGKYRVCSDGPVFNSEQLKEVRNELGVFKRDFTSAKIEIK